MAGRPSGRVLRQVQRLFQEGAVGPLSDPQLLDRFLAHRDEAGEEAFAALMSRHGPMVLRVCRDVLGDADEADDAYQATFFVLARKASRVVQREKISSWLYKVAFLTAMKARCRASRRRSLDHRGAERRSESYLPVVHDPDREIVHEEINRLPERLRAPVVLHYLQGLTYDAAARQLNLPASTILGRLDEARKQLRRRLIRRGVTAPAGLLGATFSVKTAEASVSPALQAATVRAVLAVSGGRVVDAGMVSASTLALAKSVLRSLFMRKLMFTMAAALVVVGSISAVFVRAQVSDAGGRARAPQAEGPALVSSPKQPEAGQGQTTPKGVPDEIKALQEQRLEALEIRADCLRKRGDLAWEYASSVNQCVMKNLEPSLLAASNQIRAIAESGERDFRETDELVVSGTLAPVDAAAQFRILKLKLSKCMDEIRRVGFGQLLQSGAGTGANPASEVPRPTTRREGSGEQGGPPKSGGNI